MPSVSSGVGTREKLIPSSSFFSSDKLDHMFVFVFVLPTINKESHFVLMKS